MEVYIALGGIVLGFILSEISRGIYSAKQKRLDLIRCFNEYHELVSSNISKRICDSQEVIETEMTNLEKKCFKIYPILLELEHYVSFSKKNYSTYIELKRDLVGINWESKLGGTEVTLFQLIEFMNRFSRFNAVVRIEVMKKLGRKSSWLV